MKRNKVKFFLDIMMALILFLLYKPEATSLTVHEIIGIAIGTIFIVHILLNGKWIINVTAKLFSKKVNGKTKLSYVLNLVLLVDMVLVLVSGLFISKIVFPDLRVEIGIRWLALHIVTAIVGLVIVGIHVGLHWSWVKQMGKQFPKLAKFFTFNKPVRQVIARILLVIGTALLLAQLPKAVTLTPSIISSSDTPFEERGEFGENHEGRPAFAEQHKERGEREHGEDHHREFSALNLIGAIPIAFIYALAIAAVAFYTHLIENKARLRRTKIV